MAVQIGLLIPETILYTAMAAIGTFCTPSYEMGMANRLARLFILICTDYSVARLACRDTAGPTVLAFTNLFRYPTSGRSFLPLARPQNHPGPVTGTGTKHPPEILRPRDTRRQAAPAMEKKP